MEANTVYWELNVIKSLLNESFYQRLHLQSVSVCDNLQWTRDIQPLTWSNFTKEQRKLYYQELRDKMSIGEKDKDRMG